MAARLLLALGLLLAGDSASADRIFRFAIDPASSIVHTSGGTSGGGVGDLQISGTFDLRLIEPPGQLSVFENVAVSTSPAAGFVFPDFMAADVLDNVSLFLLRGTQSNPSGLPDDRYEALIDTIALELEITGVYHEPVVDGIVYDYVIHTVAIPEPATLPLVALGLVVLGALARRSFATDAAARRVESRSS